MPTVIDGVVCAVDLSPFSPLVVAHGVELARRAGVPLHLFHAVHDPQDSAHATTLFERGGGLFRHRSLARQRMQDLLHDAGVSASIDVAFGDPVEQTLAFLSRRPPCLVVSASHGVSGFRRLLIGTVVERLTRSMTTPMLVVRPPERESESFVGGFHQVVAGCDAGGHWMQLGPLMPMLQSASGTRLHLLHVLERPPDAMAETLPGEDYNHAQEDLRQRLQDALYQRARDGLPDTCRLAVSVVAGDPGQALLQAAAADEADLIVVGVRRSGRMERWIAGSTTEAVLRRATCSVLTLPEAGTGSTAGGGLP